VRAIRDLPPPCASAVLVSGNTAGFIDQKQSLIDHAPLVVGLIALTTLVLLFLLTGSVLLPIKTLAMNSLTLAATLGILVLAFQAGGLDGPLGYEGPAAIEVTSLVFLFAVIFGLATDYAVLVMARIKERHDLGDANQEAVATGIARTGRVITAAALAIAIVFLAFGVSAVFFVKQIAIGMAVGVMLDATVVRALLVPSLMRLFGEWNWWAPKPLRRIYARLGFSEA
jgi:putative drug exporter of the RND superfamily